MEALFTIEPKGLDVEITRISELSEARAAGYYARVTIDEVCANRPDLLRQCIRAECRGLAHDIVSHRTMVTTGNARSGYRMSWLRKPWNDIEDHCRTIGKRRLASLISSQVLAWWNEEHPPDLMGRVLDRLPHLEA